MCNLSSYVEERGIERGIVIGMEKGMEKGMKQGIEKGVEKNTLFSIQSLMETIGFPLEQAMTALRVPESDRPKYRKLLRKQSFCYWKLRRIS